MVGADFHLFYDTPNNKMISCVDILMPVFNGAEHLATAVESVLRQDYSNFRLVIINDGSCDESGEIADYYVEKNPNVSVIHQNNMGMGESLNRAMKASTAKYIARLDADDEMVSGRLQAQVAYLDAHKNVAVVASRVQLINTAGDVVGSAGRQGLGVGVLRSEAMAGTLIGFHHPSVMFRREMILKVGGYRGKFWPVEDVDLWNRVVERSWDVFVLDEFLTRYRLHDSSVCCERAEEVENQRLWVKLCRDNRRSGKPEPDRDAFDLVLQNQSVWERWQKKRKLRGHIFYKKSALCYSSGKAVKAVLYAVLAIALRPKKNVMQIFGRLKK